MTKSNYTPGPWIAVGGWVEVEDPDVADICSCKPTSMEPFRHPNEQCANARLIAAAPELLEALELAVKQNQHDMILTGEELRKCAAAIAKARGEK